MLDALDGDEITRLRELSIVFLHEKSIEGQDGLVLDERACLHIAAQACLPILNLGLDRYRGWISVLIYPAGFRAHHSFVDDAGVQHEEEHDLIGEAWELGPVVLSWADIERHAAHDGFNVVIHEFAHKLDIVNGGRANGFPALESEMCSREWSRVFRTAYDDLRERVDGNTAASINAYAATDPAEFFAVASETFFDTPEVLFATYPKVYCQLSLYYHQDPGLRRGLIVPGGSEGISGCRALHGN